MSSYSSLCSTSILRQSKDYYLILKPSCYYIDLPIVLVQPSRPSSPTHSPRTNPRSSSDDLHSAARNIAIVATTTTLL
jgi:hypothetical protein